MGLLDPKTRFVDSVITLEGRRQIAQGKLKAEYYSFSDAGAIYAKSDVYISGSGFKENLATICVAESTSKKQDSLTLESDDSGKLVVRELLNLSGSSNIKIINGQVFSGSYYNSMSLVNTSTGIGDVLSTLLSSSFDNFKELQILQSPDVFNEDYNSFELSRESIGFTITDERPIPSDKNGGIREANIDNVESLFADKRLSHIPNFQFLPPVNKVKTGSDVSYPIGTYTRLNQPPIQTLKEIEDEIEGLRKIGFVEDVSFTKTSRANRLFSQFFEVAATGVTKLDVIDFGSFQTKTTEQLFEADDNRQYTNKHIYFVGKVYTDSKGSQTFVNMFTLIFS